ncbi:hypothetical protein ACFX2I_038291 [Malus domestica]
MHTPPHSKTRVYTILGAQSGVYTAGTLDLWLIKWLLAGTVLERFFVFLCPTSRHLIKGMLHLDALQELIHQGSLMCEGVRQLYDLSRQVLFTIWVGRAWTKCVSLSSGSMVDSKREI